VREAKQLGKNSEDRLLGGKFRKSGEETTVRRKRGLENAERIPVLQGKGKMGGKGQNRKTGRRGLLEQGGVAGKQRVWKKGIGCKIFQKAR